MDTKGSERRSRSRSRSPPRPSSGARPSPRPSPSASEKLRQDAVPGERLERHKDAQRDSRPAWMTRGVGVNKEFFGETKGDLVKPGMTKADLERIESSDRAEGPAELDDFFSSRR